ncbi:TlpA family protein disulfide reductase [Chloroflexota bacterium]
MIGKQAPDFQLINLEGRTVSLSDLRGEPVLINFWAIWCSPCRGELLYIQQIYDEWSGKGLVILAIKIGESSSEVSEFMKSYILSFPVILDTGGKVAQKYNIRGIPTTLFIDRDGVIRDKIIGAFQNKAQIEERLDKIIQ